MPTEKNTAPISLASFKDYAKKNPAMPQRLVYKENFRMTHPLGILKWGA
jgi:hypothetical protein